MWSPSIERCPIPHWFIFWGNGLNKLWSNTFGKCGGVSVVFRWCFGGVSVVFRGIVCYILLHSYTSAQVCTLCSIQRRLCGPHWYAGLSKCSVPFWLVLIPLFVYQYDAWRTTVLFHSVVFPNQQVFLSIVYRTREPCCTVLCVYDNCRI